MNHLEPMINYWCESVKHLIHQKTDKELDVSIHTALETGREHFSAFCLCTCVKEKKVFIHSVHKKESSNVNDSFQNHPSPIC